MRPRNKIIKLPTKESGMIAFSVFRTENTNHYFAKAAESLLQCTSIEFKVWSKGNQIETQLAASFGKYITRAQISEVIQGFAGTQFSLKCELKPSGTVDVMFNLYDDNIEILCPHFFEQKVMALFADVQENENNI
jgi:hypothetical protein